MYYVRTAYVCIYIIIIYTTLFTVQGTAATKQFKKKQQLTVRSGGHICPTV